MTKGILYPYYCCGCANEKRCHDDCEECDFIKTACENLDDLLIREKFIKSYKAVEGDVRVITETKDGIQKRYTINDDGALELKM